MTRLPALTENQLEIMNIVWDQPDITVLEVTEKLSETREIARNTVQTMLTRLADKGWLKYRKVGNTFRYSATRSKNATAKSMLVRLSELVFEGSTEALIASLVDGEQLSKAEATRMRQVIDEAEAKSKSRGKKNKS